MDKKRSVSKLDSKNVSELDGQNISFISFFIDKVSFSQIQLGLYTVIGDLSEYGDQIVPSHLVRRTILSAPYIH